jgi:DNA segregation ATPase FtsK/SpoIIIE-like protein
MNIADEERLYLMCVGVLVTTGRASTSFIQRQLAIGYNDASKLVERAVVEGIVTEPNFVGKREVLLKAKTATH